ncbi:unnamed protein product [Paramecium octaurelia]|uniref:Uncharacterized protein n=1 Tax=Paramecium octaurelia TaxID=43137 RepID=A0A8S1UI30_PAROT|nr:unnamed protein product [Paramecium octaurelia]
MNTTTFIIQPYGLIQIVQTHLLHEWFYLRIQYQIYLIKKIFLMVIF